MIDTGHSKRGSQKTNFAPDPPVAKSKRAVAKLRHRPFATFERVLALRK
jgi:hypothetical protein